MKFLVDEYGTLALVVLLCSITVFLVFKFGGINGEFTSVVKTNMLYNNEQFKDNELDGLISSSNSDPRNPLTAFDAGDGVANPLYDMHKHYFYLAKDITDADYVFEVPPDSELKVDPRTGLKNITEYSFNDVLKLFSAGNKIRLNKYDEASGKYWSEMGSGVDGNTVPITDSSLRGSVDDGIQISITKMTPVSSGGNGGSTANAIVYEDVPLKDKFGNKMKDANGNVIKTKQIKYNEYTYNKKDLVSKVDPYDTSNTNFKFIINWDTASKFKVTYRYTVDTIKAEYTAVFVNKVRTATDIYEEVFGDWEKERS